MTTWQAPHFETIAGTRIHAVRAPRAGAPRALLLTPWPHTLLSFRAAWPTLAEALDLTAIDLPGFGHSDPPSGEMSPSALADFLLAVLDHFSLDRVHLVGGDVGVPVALSFAARHAERAYSLVLSDGPGTAQPTLNADLRRMVASGFFRWMFALAPGMFVRTALRNGYVRRKPDADAVADFIAAYGEPGRLAGTLRFLASYPTELAAIDAALPSIALPTLLLWGERDVFVSPANAHAISARLAHGEVQLLPGAGHFSNDDEPEAWAAAVVAWCRKSAA